MKRKALSFIVLTMAVTFFGCATQKPSLTISQETDKTGSYNLKYKSSYPKEISAGHLLWNASNLTLKNGYEYFVPTFFTYNQKTKTSSVLIFMGKGAPPQGSLYIYAKPLMAFLEKVNYKMPLQKEDQEAKFDNDLKHLIQGMNSNPNGN